MGSKDARWRNYPRLRGLHGHGGGGGDALKICNEPSRGEGDSGPPTRLRAWPPPFFPPPGAEPRYLLGINLL